MRLCPLGGGGRITALSHLLSIILILLHQVLFAGVRKAVVVSEVAGCFHEL